MDCVCGVFVVYNRPTNYSQHLDTHKQKSINEREDRHTEKKRENMCVYVCVLRAFFFCSPIHDHIHPNHPRRNRNRRAYSKRPASASALSFPQRNVFVNTSHFPSLPLLSLSSSSFPLSSSPPFTPPSPSPEHIHKHRNYFIPIYLPTTRKH